MKTYGCLDCGETDPTKFYGAMKTCCYSCAKARHAEYYRRDRSEETHLCKFCGEDDYLKFSPNSRVRCLECTVERYRLEQQLVRGMIMAKVKSEPDTAYSISPQLVLSASPCQYCGCTSEEKFTKHVQNFCDDCLAKRDAVVSQEFYAEVVARQGGERCSLCAKPPAEIGELALTLEGEVIIAKRGLLCKKCYEVVDKFFQVFAYLRNTRGDELKKILLGETPGVSKSKNLI